MSAGAFEIKPTSQVEFELWEVNERDQTHRPGHVVCEDKGQALDLADSFTEQSADHITFVVVKATTRRVHVTR